MSSDFTEHQSDDELRKARKLSVEPTRPPAKIEGYSIQNFIGRGSYGEVWSAIDQKTGKRVAVKFYAQRSSVDVAQLAQEVEKLVVLAADRHVVQLLDVGWDASPPFYVMDFIESGSLEDRIKTGNAMPVDRAVEVFREVATGLMHLHGKGVLHCDLKPGNVLLDTDGKPRLADFGQSRLKTDSSSALGTLFYMAPEQADLRSAPDAKWDVYGLGALLFTMLTGKPPYYSDDLKQKVEAAETLRDRLKIYRQTLLGSKRPREHRSIPGVDRTLADIIDRCVAARPSDRFASAQSVLVALQQRDVKHQQRPLMLLGILGPVLLLVLMSLFGWWAVHQATKDADSAIIAKARDSNQFAAQLAARSAAEQLDEYFRVVRQISKDEAFLEAFDSMLQDEELAAIRRQLSDPNKNRLESSAPLQQALVDHPARQKLQPFLQELLDDPHGEFPEAASWFVTDRIGNQVAGAFEGGKGRTVGKNFSFRTYFTGLPCDLKDDEKSAVRPYLVEPDPEKRPIIQKPHLSASFLSQASNLRKVAFSAPIRDDQNEIVGIVAVTVNLGKLVDFDDSFYHYVMLVDNRENAEGKPVGIILEHPLFVNARRQSAGQRLPDELTDVQVDLQQLVDSYTSSDPFSETESGQKNDYDREFIVASSDVSKVQLGSPNDVGVTGRDGIFVVALEDYESVMRPSRKLSERLGRLAIMAFLILLSVAIAMWLLVNRMFRESRRRLVGIPGDGSLSTFGSSNSTPSTTGSEQGATTRGSEDKAKTN
ncbi:serine/threonine protein kinase [Mariniblastus fucicola]|uniref:Serine/threonine-protein kinase PknL n=1 Tax=Mariniblastus fucicola TaxID=980251 RepID=A0A5B9PC24_9BACT|nr:serine/threonine protein kinase [Mariniblastus fucicola]QEG22725.1 Serine/threonine-protein kinase PknL [Mariniblastus fucicola]